jgi:uncharacterized protein (TIGR03435 family)
MSHEILATAFIALVSLPLRAQPPQEFEAASIKPAKDQTQSSMRGGPGTGDPSQLRYSNVTLAAVIEEAYDVRRYQISGGGPWLDSERFDFLARVPEGATKDDLKGMLRRLLADRFKLVEHSETKLLPNYSLVVDKGGPKLKSPEVQNTPKPWAIGVDDNGAPVVPSAAFGHPVTFSDKGMWTVMGPSNVTIVANSQPLSNLARALENHAGRPVLDATGLTALYDFSITFASTAETRAALLSSAPPGECVTCKADDEPIADLRTAVKERLGLSLVSGKAPLHVVVIEHIERTPTEN